MHGPKSQDTSRLEVGWYIANYNFRKTQSILIPSQSLLALHQTPITMKRKWLIFVLIFGLVVAENPPYRPSGWRPDGRSFNPSRLRSYGPPPPSNTYGPQNEDKISPIPSTTTTTTTEAPTTTTPRSREPTTPFEDQVETGPALAVANSFAFNRPVYVYNSFPYYSGYTLLK